MSIPNQHRNCYYVGMQSLPDYLCSNLRLVFVGFNPSIRSAEIGHYYAGRGNLFWPLLYESGLIPEPLTFTADARVMEFGIGLTDLVKRASPSSGDLTTAEARAGIPVLEHKLLTYQPSIVCFNGKGVYAWYSRQTDVLLGLQDTLIGTSRVFVMSSTSARNGRFSRSEKMSAFHTLAQLVNSQSGYGRTSSNSRAT